MFAVILAALTLAAPAQAEPSLQNLASIQDALDTELTDYPSARFRRVRASEDGSFICGEVNSRSPAGGYEGWKVLIIVNANGQPEVQIAQAPAVARDFLARCGQRTDWRTADYSKALDRED